MPQPVEHRILCGHQRSERFDHLGCRAGRDYGERMRVVRSMAVLGLVAGGAAVITGCATDALIWGSDGARVIAATEQLISDVAGGGPSTLVCADAQLDLGTPADWEGRSAGEPERFTGVFWAEQVSLDPQWSINLEGLPHGATPGDRFPGDLLYREGDDGLCLIDVAWTTLESRG